MTNELTPLQKALLFTVGHNSPVSVADAASHALVDESSARGRLATLERKGLVARTYTGHHERSQFCYVVTTAGAAVMETMDAPEDPNECDLCGGGWDSHRRHCMFHPDKVARRNEQREIRR